SQRVVGNAGLRHQVGTLRLDSRIHVLAVIAVRPTVEGAVDDRSDVVGNEVVAQLVALIHGRPQLTALWIPVQSVRVAQARGEHARIAARGIDLENGGATLFILHAVLSRVAVGADSRIDARAIGARDDVLGPVVVDGASRQVDDLGASS